MPKVPTLSGPQVAEQAGPRIRSNIQVSGQSFVGQALKNVGQAASKIGEVIDREKDRADKIRVNDIFNGEEGYKRWNALELDGKVLSARGETAMSAYDEYRVNRQAKKDSILKSLANDNQRRLFKEMSRDLDFASDNQAGAHQAKETHRIAVDSADATIKTNRMSALLNYSKPALREADIEIQRQAINEKADLLGYKDEKLRKSYLIENMSVGHKQMIYKMINEGNDILANEYFHNNKEEITADDNIVITNQLEGARVDGDSHRQASQIWIDAGGDITKALEMADKIKDTDVSDATKQRLRQKNNDIKAAKDQAQKDMFQSAYNILDEKKTLESIPKTLLRSLSPSQQQSLKQYARQLESGPIQTDRNAYYELSLMAGIDRKAFLRADLNNYRHKLSDADFKKFVDNQAKGLQGDNSVFRGIESRVSIARGEMEKLDIETGARANREDKERQSLYYNELNKRIAQYLDATEKTEKQLTNEEIREISRNMTEEIILKEGVWYKAFIGDVKKPAFEITVNDIPSDEVYKIEESLQRNNEQITDERIIELFIKKQKKNK